MVNLNRENKRSNRTTIIIALVACLFLLGGTIAWLTSTSELTNTFTVGTINPVDADEDGPGDVEIPDLPQDELDKILSDNLYEPNWVADSKLLPGSTITKDPYVGLGAKSEEAYMFVNVENTMANNGNICFELNNGWFAVDAQIVTTGGKTYYTDGLFMYDSSLAGADSGNVWTATPLFSEVIISDDAVAGDFVDVNDADKIGDITVKSFIHQAKAGDGSDLKDTAVAAAKAKFGF